MKALNTTGSCFGQLLKSWLFFTLAAGLSSTTEAVEPKGDWLINPALFPATIQRAPDGKEITLANGLVRRVIRLQPAAATVALDNLTTGESLVRSVRAEGMVTLNGSQFKLGGLLGQPAHNFLKPEWLDALKADPAAWVCTGITTGRTVARFDWQPRREWLSTAPAWPPPGVRVTFEYAATPEVLDAIAAESNTRREVLLEDNFARLAPEWQIHASSASPRTSFQNEGKPGEIMAFENTAVYAERALPAGVKVVQCLVDPGTDKSASWGPGLTLVWPNRVVKFYLRPGKGIFGVNDNGQEHELEALAEGQAYWLRIHLLPSALRFDLSKDGQSWKTAHSLALAGPLGDPKSVRLGKTSRNGGKDDFPERGNLERCHLKQFMAYGKLVSNPNAPRPVLADVKVQVHYELYDGLPLFAKWISITNTAREPVVLNAFVAEQLAVVEPESAVDGPAGAFRSFLRSLEVFSDYAFGGMMTGDALSPAIRWKTDPLYRSQVHYERQTPCLLEASPPYGPDQVIPPGGGFESFRVFELVHDNTERERRGLALRRAYRALAPWVQENPVLMHVRSARPEAVKLAVDQCADVGFEMVIMTFGSGFEIERETPEYLAQIKELADYARARNIALGGYSLLASRSINAENDCINPATGRPGGMRFGNSPCIGSRWGTNYFRKLYQFYEKTGCAILEHDGSYPGDVCASTNHPGHRGLADSQWNQWRTITDYYQWCRARGVYLNVPDWYFLNGSSKTGMGYREDNWSLPREQQEIIERQNVYDGTWEKAPSMGWMFVPLVEYHGGGPAATIEPLKDHLDHYEARLANLFGAGVQACYRGPRLYDAPETRAVVKRWVEFYKQHRAILDSDLIHLRRPDGRDWDGWLHVNPALKERGLAMFYNPLPQPITRTLRLPLYYTGLTERARMRRENGRDETIRLAADASVTVTASIPARGRTWMLIESP